jgi:hypothetical protein
MYKTKANRPIVTTVRKTVAATRLMVIEAPRWSAP